MKRFLSVFLLTIVASGSLRAEFFRYGPLDYIIETDSTVYAYGANGGGQSIAGLREIKIPAKVTNGGKTYTVVGVKSVGGYAASATSITLPSTIEWIGDYAFSKTPLLCSITIPDKCVEIGDYAFAECPYLQMVQMGKGVKTIGKNAFATCPKLTTIKFNSGVETIGANVFYECTALKNMTLPDSLETLGGAAFAKCTALTTITMKDKIKTIGENCFWGCSKLKHIHFGSTQNIGIKAFYGCDALTTLVLPETLKKIEHNAFNACSALDTVRIPDAVTLIEREAFMDCPNLRYVSIGKNTYKIGESAFKNCPNLTTFVMNKRLRAVEKECFYGCSSLASIVIPDKVTTIDYQAFMNCSKLTSVVIGEKVKKIGVRALYNCESLKDLHIGSSVEDIQAFAFSYCTALDSIYIPKSVNRMGNGFRNYDRWGRQNVFVGCKNLKRIVVDKENLFFTDLDGSNAIFQKAYADYNGDKYEGINSFYLENPVNPVLELLTGCQNTILPDSGLTLIQDYAFTDIPIKSIVIPNGVKEIRTWAFYGCSELTSVTFPASSEDRSFSIAAGAFADCKKLTTIVSYSVEPPRMELSAFKNVEVSNITIYCPEDSEDAYLNAFGNLGFSISILDEE